MRARYSFTKPEQFINKQSFWSEGSLHQPARCWLAAVTSTSKPPDKQQKWSDGKHVADFLYLHIKHDTWGGQGESRQLPGSPVCVMGSDTTAPPLHAGVVLHHSRTPADWGRAIFTIHVCRWWGEVLSCWASRQASAGDGERMTESGSQMELSMQPRSVQVRNEEKQASLKTRPHTFWLKNECDIKEGHNANGL